MKKNIAIILILTAIIGTSLYAKSEKRVKNIENTKSEIKSKNEEKEIIPVLIPVRRNGMWGFSDTNGKIVIEAKYREVYSFKSGYAVVKDFNEEKMAGKYGVINYKGESVVKADYDFVRELKENIFIVKQGEKYGAVNINGKTIINTVMDEMGDFSEKVAYFKLEGKYGYIGADGKIKIKPMYDKAFNFSNGAARVVIGESIRYIDLEGKFISEKQFKEGRDFKDGVAAVKEDNKYGYIDKRGKYVVEPIYENGFDFSEGYGAVKKDGKYGFVNLKGEETVKAEYDFVTSFKEGKAVVEKQKKSSYIGTDGKRSFEEEYDEASPFSSGAARVKLNGKYGYINRDGKKITEIKYSQASDFEDGFAKVTEDNKVLIIDINGKEYKIDGVEIKDDKYKLIDDLLNLKQDGLFYTDKSIENSLMADSSYQKLMEKNFNINFFKPWHRKDVTFSKEEFKGILNSFEKYPGFGENKLKHNADWMKSIRENSDENSFPSMNTKAITISDSSLRLLPTNSPSFDDFSTAGGGYPFDNLQNSALNINSPLNIMHKSKDGAWYFAESAFALGWVRAEDIAFVDEKFIAEWETGKYAAVTMDDSSVTDDGGIFRFLADVGAVFPKVSEDETGITVKIAIADINRNGVIKSARLKKESIINKPMEITQKNVATMINRVIGKPYGWGGMNEDRDCSATLRDLLTPFGLWLPRNSAEQAKNGIFISLKNLAPADKEKMIIDNGVPYLTLIWIKGHIMLYIGTQNGRAVTFQNVWGVKTKDMYGVEGRKIIGGSVITTLEPGKELPDSYGTLLNKIEGITILVPPAKIQEIVKE